LTDLWTIVRDRSLSSVSDYKNGERIRNTVEECSAKISAAFDQIVVSETRIDDYRPDELKVSFTLPSLSTRELPNESLVSSTRMEIFGLQETDSNLEHWRWDTYIDQARRDAANPEWPKELDKACIDFATGRLSNFSHTYKSTYTGKTYQPIVYRHLLQKTGGPHGKSYAVTIQMIETSSGETEFLKIDDNLVFVIAAFNEESEVIYEGIKAAADSVQLNAKRVKDVIGDYRITEQLLNMIRSARLIVCDLSFERPNVYFELGFARGIGKTVITIARKAAPIHFDVKDWTCIFYNDSREVERDLRTRFQIELGTKTDLRNRD